LAATKTSHILQQRYTRPLFPTNDVTDTLSWFSGCKFFFRGQHTRNNKELGYAIFHIINIAQLRYMHLTGIKSATNTEHVGHRITEYLDRPTRGDQLDK
jgi:hypothetical protein